MRELAEEEAQLEEDEETLRQLNQQETNAESELESANQFVKEAQWELDEKE